MISENDERPMKKRARKSSSTSESTPRGKKQRGRPKVDTQDETAADRRRTQIRLAQRAYRQRKETTITTLQKQVGQLQSIIESMSSSFLRFNEHALASDIFSFRPQLASELRSTTDQIVHLAETAKKVGEVEEEECEQVSVDPTPQTNATPHTEPLELELSSRNVYEDIVRARQASDHTSSDRSRHVGWGYFRMEPDAAGQAGAATDYYSGFGFPTAMGMMPTETSIPERQFQSSVFPSFPFPNNPLDVTALSNPMPGELDPQVSYGNEDIDNTNNALTITTPPLSMNFLSEPKISFLPTKDNPLRIPFTYSFQETTFARRLQRACLERSFHLLSTANLRPSAFLRVFRLCRHYSTREELIGQFRAILQQSVLEPLEFVRSPFLHLGGAGTHYPKRDVYGNMVPQTCDSYLRMGPWATKTQIQQQGKRRTESSSSSTTNTTTSTASTSSVMTPPSDDGISSYGWARELQEDLRGYEGEWFDCHDVEGYLAELGVHIDAQASFAEAAVRTLEFIARQADEAANNVHPDAEIAVLDESLDQDAPNHLMLGLDQQKHPQQQASPAATVSNVSIADLPVIDPTAYDGWDRFYDLDLAWLGDNQPGNLANAVDMGMDGVTFGDAIGRKERREVVTIDVQRLVNSLIKRCVCIGRGPGFRRSDVNYALRAAIIEGF
ncbi:uncharacterized protein K452DRAFT_56344 [Aplosporella prunicola CBS 121167]|uniref:BZIP domain-containing protein n=1 Tax=Aplosporella prunicola CBS 121167 TaxID=1176127 RepID=A0A6A6B8X3_9PEZI|nr:uncharacterized protein K452DRAFT_56344 [Aplosporella prunicola CBS 121167]KAF2139813.1 hypothetical protein K452DRAFT_56344 [Aplosporella prunicola CBS 121167]